MLKKELIYREILFQVLEKRQFVFTQKELAVQFGFSLSTIFNALTTLRETGAILVTGRNFTVVDAEKILYIWATERRLSKEIIYQTFVLESVGKIEGRMPAGVVFGAYSAYVLKYQDAPADYGRVYVYADETELAEIKKRFPFTKGKANLFVLAGDESLRKFGAITPDIQTFVDLWNLSDWYAKDFLKALKDKIFRYQK